MNNNTQDVNTFDMFTIKRWMALIDGVNLIYSKAEEHGVALEDVNLKQNHLIKFIDERTEKIKIV